jgi:hypothetical protein
MKQQWVAVPQDTIQRALNLLQEAEPTAVTLTAQALLAQALASGVVYHPRPQVNQD